MTRPGRYTHRWLVFLGLAIITVGGIVAFLLGQDAPPSHTSAVEPVDSSVPIGSWPVTSADKSIAIRVDQEDGPVLANDDGTTTVLTPHTADLQVGDWTVESRGDRTEVAGTGTLGRADASAVWTFMDGNPQVHLALAFRGIPPRRLTSPLTVHYAVAEGLLWQPEGRPSTSGLAAHQDRAVSLWQPGPTGEECGTDDGARVDLQTQFVVTFGDPTPVSTWAHSHGASATVVPIFDVPATHPDSQLVPTAAPDAHGWTRRVKALAYGHSNPDDPRYGNGGLLGHGLGGAIVVPPAWATHPDVQKLARALDPTRLELIPRGPLDRPVEHRARVVDQLDCQTWMELSKQAVSVAVVDRPSSDSPPTDQPGGDRLTVNLLPLPSIARPQWLDGQLSTLLDRGFDPRRLTKLAGRRARFIFAAPFVATRNPISPAATETLLDPERDGQWTVAASVSRALSAVELLREANPVQVTSLSAASSYAAASRQVRHWWTAEGNLEVYNPGADTISGYTILVDGLVRAKLGKTPLPSRPITTGEDHKATLLWWDLAPRVNTLHVTADDARPTPPAAIHWQIDQN